MITKTRTKNKLTNTMKLRKNAKQKERKKVVSEKRNKQKQGNNKENCYEENTAKRKKQT